MIWGRTLLVLAGVAVLTTACLPKVSPTPAAAPVGSGFNGALLDPPVQVQPFTLQRVDGSRLSQSDLAGRVSLFFFGYTFCPDVCPLTLVHVSQMRKELGDLSRRVDAYFVTVDPERDTPQRLGEYMVKFEGATQALTGTPQELEQAQSAFSVVARRRDLPGSAVGYLMDHSAGLYLVDHEARLRLVFPYGVSPAEIAADVRKFILQAPAVAAAPKPTAAAMHQQSAAAPGIAIEGAWAREASSAGGTSAVYLTLRATSAVGDVLKSARSDVANATEIHRSFMEGGVMKMAPVDSIPVPANGTAKLEPGGLHIMLIGLKAPLQTGAEIEITLNFERAGNVAIKAPVRAAAGPTGGH